MSRATISKHYARILTKWPVDSLRPEHGFQKLLTQRVNAAPSGDVATNTAQATVAKVSTVNPELERGQVNALYALLNDRFKQQYAMSDSIMHPASAPDYYTTLVSEIEESPRRSWLRNMINKFTGMVRMK